MRVKILTEKQEYLLESEINKFIESIEEDHIIKSVDIKMDEYSYYALICYEEIARDIRITGIIKA